jgi:predicted metal-dependent hydrolase
MVSEPTSPPEDRQIAGREPDELPRPLASALVEGVRLFNAGQFFEAHETLETGWRAATGPVKLFFKGLIHAAVGLYQYGQKRRPGAISKLKSTHHYLGPFAPKFCGIRVDLLLADMDAFFEGLQSGAEWHPDGWPRPAIQEALVILELSGKGRAGRRDCELATDQEHIAIDSADPRDSE